jgi:hypothetical protein
MLTYHNDPKLKADMVAEIRMHQEQDHMIKGAYEKRNGHFKGCAVGCAVESLNKIKGLKLDHDKHSALAESLGWGEWLERLHDYYFESLPSPGNQQFAVDLLDAVPVGKDITRVEWQFKVWLMDECKQTVEGLELEASLKSQVLDAIQGVRQLFSDAIESGELTEEKRSAAWSAESAARSAESAARSAESAAWSAESAAWSAARSAAWSAESAESAAVKKSSQKLLNMLRSA